MNGNIIIGAGLGQAIGDYIGFQVENESGERAHAFGLKMFEPNMTFAGVPQSLRPPHKVGQVSYNTQMTSRLISHLTDKPGYMKISGEIDIPTLAKRLASKRLLYIGASDNTLSVLNDIDANIKSSLHSAIRLTKEKTHVIGHTNRKPNDGAANYVWPLAFCTPWTKLAQTVDDVAAITHGNHAAREAMVLHAAAVKFIAEGHKLDSLLELLDTFTQSENLIFAQDIITLTIKCLKDPDSGLDRLWMYSYREAEYRHISPAAIPTLTWALISFLRANGSFKETILNVLSGGGNTMAAAALAATLSGAYDASIPENLVSFIHDEAKIIQPNILEDLNNFRNRVMWLVASE